MTFENFRNDLETSAKQAVESFGVPERLILQEDVKLWEVTGKVVSLRPGETVQWPELVPVFSGGEEIGAATILPVNTDTKSYLVAKASLSAHIPERLDFDMEEPFTLVPEWEPTVALRLKALYLCRGRGSGCDPSYWISNEGQL